MAIKRVLLPLVGVEGAEALAKCAFFIGRAHQAQVQGLLIQQTRLNINFGGESVDSEIMRQLLEEARKERAETRQRVEQMLRTVAAPYQPVEFRFSPEEGDVAAAVAHAARLADMSVVVGGARYGDGGWQEVRDAALFQSGRPVLVVPGESVEESAFDRIVIAWKESIEAARAVAAAQPFLRRAREVHLLAVGESAEVAASLEDVEQYLQLHYAEIKSESLPYERGEGIADTLLNKSQELGGALLVMGAYSHWRWREQVFGGVTEAILSRARTPVLMAH
jgi:nucleotide-binding universal stress UspA family protein